MARGRYPVLEINLKTIRQNAEALVSLLGKRRITLTGVVKGFNALPRVVDEFVAAGCRHIASSRLDQLRKLRRRGTAAPLILLRIPSLSEIDDLVSFADSSLNSEWTTVEAIAAACTRAGKRHGIILMQDLGDLREGFYDPEELIRLAVHIERNLKQLVLEGIGTNLGCYGAVRPTGENLRRLCRTALEIERAIGRKLEIVSGGSTSSLPLLLEGGLPDEINNLRIGEAILNNRDLPELWHRPVPGLSTETFILKAQVAEIKIKPSYPEGEIFIDAFGQFPKFTDRGIRLRALLAVGKQDFCDFSKLVPLAAGVEVVGASSDHLIVDIEHCPVPVKIGDILSFGMFYPPMLFLSGSRGVRKVYRRK